MPGLAPWLEAARRGSPDALGQALETCRTYLLLIANEDLDPGLRGKVAASDVVQDTFLKAVRDFGQFRGTTTEELRGWLRAILQHNLANTARNFRDADKRQVAREVPLSDGLLLGPPDRPATREESPSAQVVAREQRTALRKALAGLPERARQVVQWHSYERLTFEEIGARLGCSADGARKAWVRAVEQMQQHLGVSGDEPA